LKKISKELKKTDKELEKLLLKNNGDLHQPKVLNKIMFMLLISDEEISMEELAKKTKYSLATLSNTIKYAEKMEMIERVPHKGTKRVFIKAKNSFYNIIKNTIKKQHEMFLPKLSKLQEIEHEYKFIEGNEKRILLIKDVRKMNEKINKINKILEEE
jgi:DNA-binding transcriptional regulator GbsR (MarR family)